MVNGRVRAVVQAAHDPSRLNGTSRPPWRDGTLSGRATYLRAIGDLFHLAKLVTAQGHNKVPDAA